MTNLNAKLAKAAAERAAMLGASADTQRQVERMLLGDLIFVERQKLKFADAQKTGGAVSVERVRELLRLTPLGRVLAASLQTREGK